MLDWLREKRQTPRAIERFWRQVLVSAINEELDRMAASHGLQVFYLGFLSKADSYEMGMPAVPLARAVLGGSLVATIRTCEIARSRGGAADCGRGRSGGASRDYERMAPVKQPTLMFWRFRLSGLTPWRPVCRLISPVSRIRRSPGIHLWFDRPITDLAACDSARPHHPVDVQQERRHGIFNWWSARHGSLTADAARRSDRAGAHGS